jgi:hypothetical protein
MPILYFSVKELKLMQQIKFKKGMMQKTIVVQKDAHIGETWVIELSYLVEHETLRVEKQIALVEKENELPIWVSNWFQDESITVAKKVLMGVGYDRFKIREITKTTDKEIHVEDQSFVKSAIIGCVKKILQIRLNKASQQIHFST